ncbi:hypothetical protein GCM10010172_66760 [Paractinoplanes ferrugineus]|uniref:Uncharacterized protein n=1 Tax=Paractinoplanes ferrugineus TaxID=113564 RepID=A0A919J3B0_9ACTN|nr:hypothetical protein [Actinoplanes ferrugineus]GIE13163.1 hypothetical protein Afe05nite_50030 [Actinoplanes ferrugineus]
MASLLVNPVMADLVVLDPAGAADVADRVRALRPRWIERAEHFWTLGVATYLDLAHSADPVRAYHERFESQNALLTEHFGDVHTAVGAALAEHLGAPTRFDSGRAALPGFHIFEELGISTGGVPNEHFDLQYEALPWAAEIVHPRQHISFTLAIRLPHEGAALEYWNFTVEESRRRRRMGRAGDIRRIAETKPPTRHPYQVGVMAVQMRSVLHRIGAVPRLWPGDQRITLQGHGIRDTAGWVLYW